MDKRRIVVLGGGYAGVHAAKHLHKAFKRMQDKVEITLIDKYNYHTLMTELHEVAGNRVDEEAVKITFNRIFAGTCVHVVQDEIVNIDFKTQRLVSNTSVYDYDYLLIGTGAEPTDFNIPGIKDHSLPLWSLDDAIRIREHIRERVESASMEKDPQKRSELMTFVVAGAGFTGIELIGELVEWLPLLCDEYGVERDLIKLISIEGLGKILNMLPDKPRAKAERYLRKKGVDIRVNSLIVRAEPGRLTLKDGNVVKAGTLIWTCGIKGGSFCESLDLADGKVGRKLVDKFMKSPGKENVYLAGDGAWFIENERPLPQIVEAAEQTAYTAAEGIIESVRKDLGLPIKKAVEPFKSKFHGFMVSIGGRYAVSHTMGFSLSGFFAMALKHFVNMIYHNGVCGFNGWWTYLKHEIVDIRNNRSLVGGLAAYKMPSYWIVMLRMFLGVMWLIEGIKKVGEGWLTDTTGGHVYWGAAKAVTDAAAEGYSQAADAVAAASDVVETVAPAVIDGVAAVVSAVPKFAPPLLAEPTALFNWVSETFVSQAPYLFQIMIVLGEIALGLCFLGGFLTFLAAAASIGLSIMLIMGAMASKEILWYIAVAVVMMGGAGRAFGLDYWVMPWIKRIWNKTPIAKRTYLFTDEPQFTKRQMQRRMEGASGNKLKVGKGKKG